MKNVNNKMNLVTESFKTSKDILGSLEINEKDGYIAIKYNNKNVIYTFKNHPEHLLFKMITVDQFKSLTQDLVDKKILERKGKWEGPKNTGKMYPGIIINNQDDWNNFVPVFRKILEVIKTNTRSTNITF